MLRKGQTQNSGHGHSFVPHPASLLSEHGSGSSPEAIVSHNDLAEPMFNE